MSGQPTLELITRTVDELIKNLPDQAWQYQLPYCTRRLANHHFVQDMSRKGH